MEFNNNKPIYRQIVDYAFNRILDGSWRPGQMVPSVRELTVELGVNNRTIMKAYETLQNLNVISPKRGMGYLLADDGVEKVREEKRRDFFENAIPAIASEMKILGISSDEVSELLKKHIR